MSRTLIFQSDTEKSTSSQPPQAQVVVKNTNTQLSAAPVSSAPVNTAPVGSVLATANSELYFMIEQLQQEVNMLRGMLEEQAHELRMLNQSSKDRYLDLDTRVLDLTKRSSSGSTVPQMQPNAQADLVPVYDEVPQAIQANVKPVDVEQDKQREPTKAESDDYQKAYSYIKDKKFDDAILALFNYTESYPNSPLLPNVYYWLGEVYLATSKLDQAKTSFSLVYSAYPGSQKAADSLYKLAVTVDSLGEKSLAKQYIQDVQKKYPDSTAAKLAASYQFK